MARKKTATPTPAQEPEVTNTQVQEPAQVTDLASTPDPAPAEVPEAPTPEEPTPEAPAPEPEPTPEPEAAPAPEPTHAEKAPSFPFQATVCVTLAILRRDIPPATAEMLRPVATLPQGTTVTITAIQDGYARLRNGLWISASHITR